MKKRAIHTGVFALLRPIFKVLSEFKFNYSYEKYGKIYAKKPCLILSNHTHNLDPFLVSLSFKMPIHFVASDQIFNIPVLSKVIEYLVAPIAKSKGVSDIRTTRNILNLLKQNRAVGIFPEGNINYFGETAYIPEAISKLIKMSKCQIVFYNIHGGHWTEPRWSVVRRRGEMRGGIREVWQPEDYENLTSEDIYEKVKQLLYVNAYEDENSKQVIYRGKRTAEGMERGLFTCPHCGGIDGMVSKGQKLYCAKCGYGIKVDGYGKFSSLNAGEQLLFNSEIEWNNWQISRLQIKNVCQMPKERVLFIEKDIDLVKCNIGERQKVLQKQCIMYFYGDRLELTNKNGVRKILLSDLNHIAMQCKDKVIMYFKGNDTLEIRGGKNFKTYRLYAFLKRALIETGGVNESFGL